METGQFDKLQATGHQHVPIKRMRNDNKIPPADFLCALVNKTAVTSVGFANECLVGGGLIGSRHNVLIRRKVRCTTVAPANVKHQLATFLTVERAFWSTEVQ